MSPDTYVKMHEGIIYLFLISFIVKVTLMFISVSTFNKVRNRTRIIEIILGPLIIVSGILALHFKYDWNMPDFLVWKIVFVSIAIPVSIVALKKGNKALALLGLALFCYIYLIARYKTLTLSKSDYQTNITESTC